MKKLSGLKKLKKKENISKHKANIVIIDDEAGNLAALDSCLSEHFTVHAFISAEEALKFFDEEKALTIDLIITDQRMPGMNGTEFLEILQKRKYSNSRILLTAFTETDDLVMCINRGLVDRYIIKPWDSDNLINVINEVLERNFKKATFERIVPEKIIEKLYPEGFSKPEVGEGIELDSIILFGDIRSFTSITEEMPPIDSLRFISSYTDFIAPLITNQKGFIDKYLGDGILAVFDRKNLFDAIQCAVQIIEKTKEYNRVHRSSEVPGFREGGKKRVPIEISLGLHGGTVALGTVGYQNRIDFTVIGDVVNTAARIQNLASALKADIMMSEVVASGLQSFNEKRYLGDFEFKGKAEAVSVWEIFSTNSKACKTLKKKSKEDFRNALLLQSSAEEEKAKEMIERIVTENPEDEIAKNLAFYQNRGKKLNWTFKDK